MPNYQDLMKQAQAMQEKLESFEAEGTAGGGMVKVLLSGKNVLRKVILDPSLKNEELSLIEDLMVAASADAQAKLGKQMQEAMGQLAGNSPFGKMF